MRYFFFREDHYGRLWLATYNGALCYYKDDSFHTAENTSFLAKVAPDSYIRDIMIDNDSSVVIIFWNGLKLLHLKNEKWEAVDFKRVFTEAEGRNLVSFETLPGKAYRIHSADSVYVFDSLLKLRSISSFYYDDDGGRTLGSGLVQGKRYRYTRHSVISIPDMRVHKTLGNAFWRKFNLMSTLFTEQGCFLGTDDGLVINDSIHALRNSTINTVNQDSLGNYWVGTKDKGIFVINKDFQDTRVLKDAYEGKVVYATQGRSHIFFCTADSRLYELQKGKAICILSNPAKNFKGRAPISGFFIDSSYKFYQCFNEGGMAVDNLLQRPLKSVKFTSNIPPAFTINEAIAIGSKLYLNAKSRILTTDMRDYKPGKEVRYKQESDPQVNERIFCMAKAPDNSIWYSYVSKLCKIAHGHFSVQEQFKNISFKFFDFYGNYLIGYTQNNQLLICGNYNGEQPEIVTVPPRNCIWDKIYKIDSIHLLIKTNNLYRLLTLDKDNVHNYKLWAIENPFLPLEVEAVCSDGNRCYFFKNGSVTSVDVEKLYERSPPPRLFYSVLKTNTAKAYKIGSEMELPYNQSKNITISFSTLSFGGTDVKYQYSVSKNEQDNWRDIKNEELNLVNSGYGTYYIKIKAKSTSSEYSAPTVFKLHILRPWWATWWFVALCVCFGAAVVGIAIRFRILYLVRKNRKEHETELKFMKSEYKALNALMNPHFIFNTLNNVQSLFNGNDKVAANEYLRIFADLIRQNMYNVSKELIPLQKEIALVMNYLMLEKLRFEDKLNYVIDVDERIDLSDIMVPPLLIQPLVENSIKHGILPLKGREGTVQVNIWERGGVLLIEIRDNGVGIAHAKQNQDVFHESFGMDNIKKRIEQLSIIQNKKITFDIGEVNEEGKHQWTVVTISMPISE